MNDCNSIISRMLEAPLEELDPASEGEIAEHLRGCASCRAAAEAIVVETRALGEWRSPMGDPDLDAILVRAGVPAEKAASTGMGRRNGTKAWLGLAAAAALATVLLRPSPPPMPGEGPTPRTPSPPPLVEAAPGRDVVVLPTRNPDITVVWFYDSEESAP